MFWYCDFFVKFLIFQWRNHHRGWFRGFFFKFYQRNLSKEWKFTGHLDIDSLKNMGYHIKMLFFVQICFDIVTFLLNSLFFSEETTTEVGFHVFFSFKFYERNLSKEWKFTGELDTGGLKNINSQYSTD